MPRRDATVVMHVGAAPSASKLAQWCLARRAAWPSSALPLSEATLRRDVGSGSELVANPGGFAGTLRQALDGPTTDLVVGTRAMLGRPFGGPPGSGLHAEAGDAIQALADATRGLRRVVVLSVCPQAELLEMYFQQAVTGRAVARVDDWLERVDLDNLSWLPLREKLLAAFGTDNVMVHRFRRTRDGREDFLRELLGAGGLPLPASLVQKMPPPPLLMSETGVRLAVAADPYLGSDRQRTQLRGFLLRHFSELDGPPGSVLTQEQKDAVNERYHDELATLDATATAPTGRA